MTLGINKIQIPMTKQMPIPKEKKGLKSEG